MKKILKLTALLILSLSFIHAQDRGRIVGVIVDAKTGEGLPG